MRETWKHGWLPWLAAWLGLTLLGALAIVRYDIAQRRALFQADARTAHRVLSQRAVQHDAILATLALMGTPSAADGGAYPERRLPGVYPQVIAALRRDRGGRWMEPGLQAAEDASRAARRPALGPVDAQRGQYFLVLAAEPASFALRLDVAQMVPWDEWPLARNGPVRASMHHRNDTFELQPGQPADAQPAGLTEGFVFAKRLAADSQPFELRFALATGPAQWPWLGLSAWAGACVLAIAGVAAWRRGRRERRRAEELLRVGRVARLNTLGELAGGIAHELNQPLAAVLASTCAAQRLLDDAPPDTATAREAMTQAATQARRAADVVARLRRLVETPDKAQPQQALRLEDTVRSVLDTLEPELRRRGVETSLQCHAPAVLADPVALEQIVHNLVGNALQALDEVPAGERRLHIGCTTGGGRVTLGVRDSGMGMSADVRDRAFEPFFTTRRGGLGLGLSLCETLAQAMHGTLSAHPASPRGAEFRLALPLAEAPA